MRSNFDILGAAHLLLITLEIRDITYQLIFHTLILCHFIKTYGERKFASES